MVKIRFRLANRRSNVAAPARMNTIFTNSEGWKVMGPTAIQFLAPKMRWPNSTLKASSADAAATSGHRSFSASGRLCKTRSISRYSPMPSTTAASCLYKEWES